MILYHMRCSFTAMLSLVFCIATIFQITFLFPEEIISDGMFDNRVLHL